ncbi:MAG: FliH/SctL family protein [Myxococcota bacterium]|nr:FliH/SctL family protein [Myxococcota bacterium]
MGSIIKARDVHQERRPISPEAIRAADELIAARRAASRMIQEAKDDIIDLAVHLAERIVGQAIERDPTILNQRYAEHLDRARDLGPAVVTVHPMDRVVSDIAAQAAQAGFEVREDASVGRGGCCISTGDAEVNATMPVALAAFKKALKGPAIG